MKTKPTVVVAEDNNTQALQLQYFLEKNNYVVNSGKDGKQALDIIKENPPDIIISDVMMPNMNGYELTKSLKEDPLLCKIPVILLTSLSALSDILKGLECGADNYIIKPYDEDELISRIETVLYSGTDNTTEFEEGYLRISYDNYSYKIDSKSTNIADFLITTHEAILRKNKALEQAQDELEVLNISLKSKNKELDNTLKLFVGRELKIRKLEEKIRAMEGEV